MNPMQLIMMGVATQARDISTSFDVTIQTSGVDDTFTLPLVSGYTYSANVDWGDESSSTITAFDDPDITHTYSVEGLYTIKITGTFEAWSFNNTGDYIKVTNVHFGSSILFKYLALGFSRCSSLIKVTGSIGNDGITSLQGCFRLCLDLASIPSGLFNNCVNVTTFSGCFEDCRVLSIPSGLFDNNTAVTTFTSCFDDCNFTSIPSGLFDNNTAVTTFTSCFAICLDLASIPSGLFNNNTAVLGFDSCFSGCSSLTGSSQELWLEGNNTLTAPDYDSGTPDGEFCYLNCTGLSDYASIPTYWK